MLHLLINVTFSKPSGVLSKVADLIGTSPEEIIFNSRATESNNITIQGLVRGKDVKRRRIVTIPIENRLILN